MVKRTTKNKILKAIGYLNLTVFLFAACLVDSDSWVPSIVCLITGIYLGVFSYANGWFEDWGC